MDVVRKELARVERKQRASHESALACAEALLAAARQALASPPPLSATPPDVPADSAAAAGAAAKELSACCGRLARAAEAACPPPAGRVDAAWFRAGLGGAPGDACAGQLLAAVALRLYRRGALAAGDALLASDDAPSAAAAAVAARRPAFEAMHAAAAALRGRDPAPALAWAAGRCGGGDDDAGDEAGPGPRPAALLFALHRLRFAELLSTAGAADALAYARKHLAPPREHPSHPSQHLSFSPHANVEAKQLRRLMGALAFPGPALARSPHGHLLGQGAWDQAAAVFESHACHSLGLVPGLAAGLDDALRAGTLALPALCKMAALVGAARGGGGGGATVWDGATAWDALGSLPAEVELPPALRFDPVFACPVARDQCGGGAGEGGGPPPLLLPCGLVLGAHTVARLARGRASFPCPYCPLDVPVGDCKPVYF